MSLIDFGFTDYRFPEIPDFDIEEAHQTDLLELETKYIYPVSGRVFDSKLEHRNKCRYRYCKKGWGFRNL